MVYYLKEGDSFVLNGREFKVKDGQLHKRALQALNKGVDYTRILEAVCSTMEVSDEELRSRCRRQHLVTARKALCYYAYNYAGLTSLAIAERLGFGHSEVLHLKSQWDTMIKLYGYYKLMDSILIQKLLAK